MFVLVTPIVKQCNQVSIGQAQPRVVRQLPILYSYPGCPFSVRASMALNAVKIEYIHEKEDFFNRSLAMKAISSTFPVLLFPDDTVMNESLDIMKWAFENDRQGNINYPQSMIEPMDNLIAKYDTKFKLALKAYKYPEAVGKKASKQGREYGMECLADLDKSLSKHKFLFPDNGRHGSDERPSYADLAIFPFVWQFAHVDEEWFESGASLKLREWHQYFSSKQTERTKNQGKGIIPLPILRQILCHKSPID